jgi:hypothetical protein
MEGTYHTLELFPRSLHPTGLNRDIFIQRLYSIIPVLIIAALSTFVLGRVIEIVGNRLGFGKAKLTRFMP